MQFCAHDDGRKTCLKHVQLPTETNKFEKRCILLVVLCEYEGIVTSLSLSYITIKWAKIILLLQLSEVSLCGGCIYSLYVDATVVLARYVLSKIKLMK